MSETALAVIEVQPRQVMERNQSVANACREIVMRCSVKLQGKQYIQAEGWQALANLSGYSPRIDEVVELDNGDYRAMCSLVRLADGVVIARAEGYVGTDERTWANRPRYARRAMAQTRATSRACRSALAFLVPLIDANLSTTPAEEIPVEVSGPNSGHNGAMSGPNSGHSEQAEEFAPARHPMDRPPSDYNLVTPKQRGLLKALTKDLPEDQLAELVRRFGPSDKLDKRGASAVIEFLKGGGLNQPAAAQLDDNYDPFAPDAEPAHG